MADRSKHSGSSGLPFQARNNAPERQSPTTHTPTATLRSIDVELPPVYLTMHDRKRLRTLTASQRVQDDDNLYRFLRREIDRAIICTPHTVPSDVVTLNSRVFYRPVGGQLKCGTLVYDDNVAVIGAAVAVFTPIGVALLGLRAGFRMPYLSQQGERSLLVVERVGYQPEAYGRLSRGRFRRWPTPPATDRRLGGHEDWENGDGDEIVIPMRRTIGPWPKEPANDVDPDPSAA